MSSEEYVPDSEVEVSIPEAGGDPLPLILSEATPSPQPTSSNYFRYSFLQDLQTPFPVQRPLVPVILPNTQSSSKGTEDASIQEPEFLMMVWDMRQNLFPQAGGKVMGVDDPPQDRNILRKWMKEVKNMYGSSTSDSTSHKRVSSNFF